MSKYLHTEEKHNLSDPKVIVPEIIRLLNPKSVVDFGCGVGTFLDVFKQEGVTEVLGIDGPWVNKDLLHQHIDSTEFLEMDLEGVINLDKKYDLVLNLEVAEHLKEESADTLVQNLISAGNLILFSAAIPFQGGQNHINEQWLTYWEKKFKKHNYVVHDVIRPIFWDNPDIFWWYRQNMVLIAPKDYKLPESLASSPIRNLVHHEPYLIKAKMLEEITKGETSLSFYLKSLIYKVFGYDFTQKVKRLIKGS